MENKKNKLFYGWVVVAVLFAITMLPMVFVSNFFSYYQYPICTELGVSYTQFSIASLLATITAIAFSVTCAGLITKGNTRMIMFIGAIICALSYVAQSYITKIWQLYITFFIANFALSAITYVPINFLISQWFTDKKALVTAIVFTGSGIGGFLFSVPMSNLIENVGWRAGFRVTAAVVAVAGVLILLFIKKSPADMGLEPYTESKKDSSSKDETKAVEQWEGVSAGQALKSSAFLFFALCMLCCGIVAAGVLTQVPAYLTEVAIDFAIVMTVMNAVSIFAKLIMGRALDSIGIQRGAVIQSIIALFGMFFLIKASSGNITMAIICMVILPFGQCVTALAPPLLAGKIFGYKEYGKIYGLGNALFMLGAMIGPIMSSIIHDKNGSYVPAWYIILGVYVFLGVFAFLSVAAGKKLRAKVESQA